MKIPIFMFGLFFVQVCFAQKRIIVTLTDAQQASLILGDAKPYLKISFGDSRLDAILSTQKVIAIKRAFPDAKYFDHPASDRVYRLFYIIYDPASGDLVDELKKDKVFDYVDLREVRRLSIAAGCTALGLNGN